MPSKTEDLLGASDPRRARQAIGRIGDDPAGWSATALATALHAREVRAVDLLDAVLARADDAGTTVNPFSVRLDLRARKAAERADDLLDRGEGAPLTGVPVSAKDSHFIAGVPTTWGSFSRPGFVPTETCGPVERLDAAGAVVFAKTTVSEFCYFGISEAPAFGRTGNPWNLERTAGGSSGGAAAHLAAGVGPLALGSDGGGSIRIPAAFCGVVGHKPTFGLVPHEPSNAGWKTLTAVGPLARCVADARLLLDAIAGHDARDRHSAHPHGHLDVPLPDSPRVAVSEDLASAPVDDDVRRAFRTTVAVLAEHGVDVVEAAPGLPSSAPTWARIACSEARYSEADALGHADDMAPDTREYLEFGASFTAGEYVRAQYRREAIHRAYADMFARTGAHALLTPTLGCEAFGHGTRFPAAIGGVSIEPPWLDWGGFLYDANLTGLPACAVPAGLGDDGMPVSMQVLGPRWEDGLVLTIAELVESLLGIPKSLHPR